MNPPGTSGARPAIIRSRLALALFLVLAAFPAGQAIPNAGSRPVRTLRIAIHVFGDDRGAANFHPDSTAEIRHLIAITEWVNHRLANLDTLKPAVPSGYVRDAGVRIRLDSIWFHSDRQAWDASDTLRSDYMRDRYIDGDSLLGYREKYQTLPVFIAANHPVVGGHSRNLGDRGYIAVRGYYESYLRDDPMRSVDECGKNLIHELGHCLGLPHNFTGGPEGDECDRCDDNGCFPAGTTNNIMDYWPNFGHALSECQVAVMDTFLAGVRGNISEAVINDSCYLISGRALFINGGDTLVISDTVYAHSDIHVRSGGMLRIYGYLSMPGGTGILAESGSTVEIDGGTAGNLCGDLWSGIRIGQSGVPLPARITVIRGGTLEHAEAAIRCSGNLLLATDSARFLNCVESLVFLEGSPREIAVSGCEFLVSSKLNHYEEGITPVSFIDAQAVERLSVSRSVFVNGPGTLVFDADWLGSGVRMDGGSLLVQECRFENLTTGIACSPGPAAGGIQVKGNTFLNNRMGVLTCRSDFQAIDENRFVLQRFNRGSTVGVAALQPGLIRILGNRFESVFGGGSMAGIALINPSGENSPVFSNVFSNLPEGIRIDGPPDIEDGLNRWSKGEIVTDSLNTGPQLRLNRYDEISLPVGIVTDSAFGTAIGVVGNFGRETGLSAYEWPAGGFAWHRDDFPLAAFRGTRFPAQLKPDHGLYLFMNAAGLTDSIYDHPVSNFEWDLLRSYIGRLFNLEDSIGEIRQLDIDGRFRKFDGFPAGLRSGKLMPVWLTSDAKDVPWIRQQLSQSAGVFSSRDSLLTRLGSVLAAMHVNEDPFGNVLPDTSAHAVSLRDYRFALSTAELFRFEPPAIANELPGFDVYPNPAEAGLTVRPLGGRTFLKPWAGRMLTADGRLVRQITVEGWNDRSIGLAGLAPGIYLVEFSSGNEYLGAVRFVKSSSR